MKLCTDKVVADWLALTPRRVRQLRDEGVIQEKAPGLYDLRRTVTRYVLYVRKGNRADLNRRWYQPRPWEGKLYRALRVKSWKDHMPTFYPDKFSPEKHTWEEIAQTMCQSELVHETNILMSFLPLAAAIPFGAFWVFFLTSLGGALFDLSLVILQRYNRPRVLRLAQRRSPRRVKG